MRAAEMRVMALQGFVSGELVQVSLSPGWHVLPNGVAAYSDPWIHVAISMMNGQHICLLCS